MARTNPYASFNFTIEVLKGPPGKTIPVPGGATGIIAGFMEASGLDMENAFIEYRNGNDEKSGDGAFTKKQMGMEKYPNVTLRRGITGHLTLWQWRKHMRNESTFKDPNTDNRREVLVRLQDENHKTVMTWRLLNAWPCKLTGPTLNSKSNEIAIESIEFVCDRVELDESKQPGL